MNTNLQRGAAALQAKNLPEALAWFERAVAEEPKDAQPRACLGQTLCWLGRRLEGLEQLQRSGQLLLKRARKNRDVGLLLSLVEQLQYWQDFQGAAELAEQAVQIDAATARGYQLLALSHSRLNRKKSALAAARRAARLAPDDPGLQILLASQEAAMDLAAAARGRLTELLQRRLPVAEEFLARKELARLLDAVGEYREVFPHLHAAAGLAAELPEVRRQDHRLVPEMIAANERGFDTELLGRWVGADFSGDPPAPLFLMGFMRSGTTLTQAVLAAHPQVFVADESRLIAEVAAELARRMPGARDTPERLRSLDLAAVRSLRAYYWERVRMLYGPAVVGRRLVDKTTMNTIDVGLINVLFPDAQLLFVMRDPRDVCLSCFMQTMAPTPSTVHLLSWAGTAEFYALIMNWWRTIRPRLSLDLIELRYEDAVVDFDREFRKIFDRLGLSWDPGVAEFHRKAVGRYISSPSHGQVAQPLYASSVARWRRYTDEFAPIAETLRPLIEAFDYPP